MKAVKEIEKETREETWLKVRGFLQRLPTPPKKDIPKYYGSVFEIKRAPLREIQISAVQG